MPSSFVAPAETIDSRLGTLHEIALALSAELDRRRLFEGIVHGARRLLGTSAVAVWSWNQDHNELVPEAATVPATPTLPPAQLPVYVGPALLQQRSITIDDLSGHPLASRFLQDMNLGSGVATPLLRQGHVLGVVSCAHKRGEGTISSEDVRLLELLAGHVALALANAETVSSAVRRIAAADELAVALRGIVEAHDRELILQRGLDCATTVLGADRAAIYIGDETLEVVFAAGRRLSRGYLEQVAKSYKKSVGQIFVLARTAVYVADVSTDPRTRVLHAAATQEGIRSLLVVPLLHRDQLMGGFALYHDLVWRYEPNDVVAVRKLADQVALALGNATLFEQTQRQLAEMRTLDAVSRALATPGGEAERARRGVEAVVSGGGAACAWVWRTTGGPRLRLEAQAGVIDDKLVAEAAVSAIAAEAPISAKHLTAAPMTVGDETLGALVLAPLRSPLPQARVPTVFMTFPGGGEATGLRSELVRAVARQLANALSQERRVAAAVSTARWLGAVLAELPDPIAVVDGGQRVVFGNAAVARLCGVAAGELTGWTADRVARAGGVERTRRPVTGEDGESLGELVIYQGES